MCRVLNILFFFVCSFSTYLLSAQTGIGTTTPDPSAKLHVSATNKGFLPPRVSLTGTSDVSTILNPAEGLLVYNLGSVGLQAGYYYWNGTNWATIATATSAGNGVTTSEMVKLYSEQYSNAFGKIAHANGYSFTVPVSGRYLFDFSCSAFTSNTVFTMLFKVRQGTTDLSTDAQTSSNNSVHVEYNGKLEVNLQAGTTYNVYVTGGSRNSDDFDRVYMKQVSGNLPVTGQSVDYVQASLSANQTLSAVGNIIFNTSSGTGITLSNGGFNLIANKTYKLEGSVGGSSTGYIYYAWVDASNTIINGGSIGGVMKAGGVFSDGPQDKAVAYYTPTSNTTVYLRVLTISGTSVAYATSSTPSFTSTWATINQIGSSAIINPWTLSGTNTYNITGNVGIGTITPAEKLDVSGNVKATNFIGGETPIYLSANKASSQSIPYNSETTVTNWNGAGWINNFPSAWNSATGVWTCPRAGIYEFFFTAALDPHSGSAIGNEFAVILSLNGSLQSVGDFWAQTSSNARTPHASTNLIMSLNVGDIVTARIYQNLNGSAINTIAGRLYFQIKQLPSRINRE